jgi:hypothetical protein
LTDEEKRETANQFLKENRIFGFGRKRDPLIPEFREPNPPQKAILEAWKNPQYKVFTFSGGNRMGKTFCGSYIGINVAAGQWLATGEKIPFMHDRPRKIRYVGQSWEGHVKAVVEPALKFWWPKSRPVETKKNNQGIEALWIDQRTKSTIEVMSNVQDSSVFEGWEGDLVIYDEPPKRDVRVACARGLIDRQGRELFCMTLLKEAWIHREVIKARLPDGSPDTTIFNVDGRIYDNLGFGLTQAGIDQFAKTLTDDEKQARLEGKPSYMSTLVLPKFDRHKHVKERFAIPLDALIDIQIDFHPSKKWMVVFMATLKNGFKYICDEIWDRGNPKYIAEEIIRKIKLRNYERVNSIEIDPLSKGGTDNGIDVFSEVAGVLGAHNYSLGTASKDKEVGIAILNNLLWTENEMPGLFYFKDCPMSIQQSEDWMYDAETLKPSKTDDDAVECIYRLVLKNTQWYDLYQQKKTHTQSVIL